MMQRMTGFVTGDDGEIARASIPVPTLADGELLVRVTAIGVGVHDGAFLPQPRTADYVIGIEGAGVIEQVGPAVVGRRSGERVAFISAMQPKGGTWAEYAVLAADALVIPIPDGMSFVEAAAIPVAGVATLRALAALPALPSGSALFVAGASGAIGTFAVQLARRRGWAVAASASPRNHDYLASLGAGLAVDYADPEWPSAVRSWRPGGVDVAIAVQPGTAAPCIPLVRDGGTVVAVSGDDPGPERGIAVHGLAYGADVDGDLRALMSDVAAGAVRLEIERVYPFSDAPAALAKVRTRRARGKVVLSLE